MSKNTAELFELGRQSMLTLIDELSAYEVYVDGGLELRHGEGLLSHYSLKDRHIYLSLPDPDHARGKFELLLLRSVLNFDGGADIMRLLELLIPWLIAHEIGHHLRHKYGLLGSSLWEEEKIANQLASAFTMGQLTLAQKQEVCDLMARAIASLSCVLEVESEFVYTARDPIQYIYTHMCWFYRNLMAHESQTIAEFVQGHLKLRERLPSTTNESSAFQGC